jgi:hypothetical protein
VVPAYQQGIDPGGSGHETADGTVFAADRAHGGTGFGYAGGGTRRTTRSAIAGTDEDPLYQTARANMTSYRFDVPVDGTYQVDLHFAEISLGQPGQRVFNVIVEGQAVVAGLDIVAEVGPRAALVRSLQVEVTDGRLDIEFVAQRGDRPIVNGILVSHRPDLGAD